MTKDLLGYGGNMWWTWSGDASHGAVVTRGYVTLNPAPIRTLTTGFGKGRTQGNVILHELGHTTGLEHVHSTSGLMNPMLTTAAPNGYSRGDLAGLAKLGVKAGCISDLSVRVMILDAASFLVTRGVFCSLACTTSVGDGW